MEELQQNYTLTTPISTPDQAMFDRVWDRVMASSQPSDVPAPLPVPTVPVPETVSKSAPCEDLPCLGSGSVQYADLLGDMLAGAHELWQSYQTLCRQTQGPISRQLHLLSEGQLGRMRQLSAISFLLTGQRYSPPAAFSPARQPLIFSLRELFMKEQHWQQTFQRGAQNVHDPCLQQLFQELSLQAQRHMDAIRRILERL